MKLGETVAFCIPTAGRRTQFFHPTFSQPGKGLLEVPCSLRRWTDATDAADACPALPAELAKEGKPRYSLPPFIQVSPSSRFILGQSGYLPQTVSFCLEAKFQISRSRFSPDSFTASLPFYRSPISPPKYSCLTSSAGGSQTFILCCLASVWWRTHAHAPPKRRALSCLGFMYRWLLQKCCTNLHHLPSFCLINAHGIPPSLCRRYL